LSIADFGLRSLSPRPVERVRGKNVRQSQAPGLSIADFGLRSLGGGRGSGLSVSDFGLRSLGPSPVERVRKNGKKDKDRPQQVQPDFDVLGANMSLFRRRSD
jgi:hypothetical protein